MGDRTRACLEAAGMFACLQAAGKILQQLLCKTDESFSGKPVQQNRPALPMTDVLAVRIICPFIGDLAKVEESLASEFEISRLSTRVRAILQGIRV
jgi:hypothetical protein